MGDHFAHGARPAVRLGAALIDDLVLRDRGVPGTLNERLYALQDANWNVVAICNAPARAGPLQLMAYGVPTVLNSDFSVKSGGTAYDWTVLYTGRELDVATGLYFYRSRDYLATLTAFSRRDPIGYGAVDANLYRYVGSNPVVHTTAVAKSVTSLLSVGRRLMTLSKSSVRAGQMPPFTRAYVNRQVRTIVTSEGGEHLLVLSLEYPATGHRSHVWAGARGKWGGLGDQGI